MNNTLKIIFIIIGIILILSGLATIYPQNRAENNDEGRVINTIPDLNSTIKKVSASDIMLGKNDLDDLWKTIEGEELKIGEIEKWPLVEGAKEYLYREIEWGSTRTIKGQSKRIDISVMETYSEEESKEWYNLTKQEDKRYLDKVSYPNYSFFNVSIGEESYAGEWLRDNPNVHGWEIIEHIVQIVFRKKNFMVLMSYSSINIDEDYKKVAIDLTNKIANKIK